MAKKKKAAKKKPTPKPRTVGEQVKAAREGARLSQGILAEMLDCSVSTIRDIEQDTPNSRTRILHQISDVTQSTITIEPRGRSRG